MPSDFLTLMLDGRVPMKFRLIPPGEFRMGSRGVNPNEQPIHRVKIKKPFYIGVYPVTQLQWRTIVESVSPPDVLPTQDPLPDLNPDPSGFKGDDRPVENVYWRESGQWCRLLNTSNAVRDCVDDAGERVEIAEVDLPTEAQWEYACRLVQTHPHIICCDTEYHTGDGEAALSAAGWYDKNSKLKTHDVGGKAPNGIGLYDMHGNVWEWCRDAWSADVYKLRIDGIADPLVSASDVGESENDALRVFRGGSWGDSAGSCRAAYRDWGGARLPRLDSGLPSLSVLRSGRAQPADRNRSDIGACVWRRSKASSRREVGGRRRRCHGGRPEQRLPSEAQRRNEILKCEPRNRHPVSGGAFSERGDMGW